MAIILLTVPGVLTGLYCPLRFLLRGQSRANLLIARSPLRDVSSSSVRPDASRARVKTAASPFRPGTLLANRYGSLSILHPHETAVFIDRLRHRQHNRRTP